MAAQKLTLLDQAIALLMMARSQLEMANRPDGYEPAIQANLNRAKYHLEDVSNYIQREEQRIGGTWAKKQAQRLALANVSHNGTTATDVSPVGDVEIIEAK